MSLTGNFRFRESIFLKIVLEVEVREPCEEDSLGMGYGFGYSCIYWRDAKEDDLEILNILLGESYD